MTLLSTQYKTSRHPSYRSNPFTTIPHPTGNPLRAKKTLPVSRVHALFQICWRLLSVYIWVSLRRRSVVPASSSLFFSIWEFANLKITFKIEIIGSKFSYITIRKGTFHRGKGKFAKIRENSRLGGKKSKEKGKENKRNRWERSREENAGVAADVDYRWKKKRKKKHTSYVFERNFSDKFLRSVIEYYNASARLLLIFSARFRRVSIVSD